MKLAKDIGLIILLTILWFGTAYYAGEALVTSWGWRCGLISLITGLIGLAIINRTKQGWRLLYDGESEHDDISYIKIVVWLVIALPFTLFFMGTLWWIMRLFGFFGFE